VAAVPQENKRAYLDQAREALSLFKDHGETRMVENWGGDVPVGKVTDFHYAVPKRDGEAFCSVGSHGGRRTCATSA
jgi:uncharacterized protein YbaA (DUF1428 family)